jgi:PIN domain nuclease of toxin-antitoxin system
VRILLPVTDAPELSDDARELFEDPDNKIYLSSVSTWEIAVKHSLGNLPIPEPLAKFIPAQRSSMTLIRFRLTKKPLST